MSLKRPGNSRLRPPLQGVSSPLGSIYLPPRRRKQSAKLWGAVGGGVAPAKPSLARRRWASISRCRPPGEVGLRAVGQLAADAAVVGAVEVERRAPAPEASSPILGPVCDFLHAGARALLCAGTSPSGGRRRRLPPISPNALGPAAQDSRSSTTTSRGSSPPAAGRSADLPGGHRAASRSETGGRPCASLGTHASYENHAPPRLNVTGGRDAWLHPDPVIARPQHRRIFDALAESP
jgi:hypothetical protein